MPFIFLCEEDNAKFSFMKTDIALTCGSEGRRLVVGGAAAVSGGSREGGLGAASTRGEDRCARRRVRMEDARIVSH